MSDLNDKRSALTQAMNRVSNKALADPVMMSIEEWNGVVDKARELFDTLDQWHAAVAHAIHELGIMEEAEGVAGYHLNGAIATWAETGLPDVRDEMQALLEKTDD